MSAKIIEVATGDNAIQLGHRQMGRILSVGGGWNDLRIVMRVKMSAVAEPMPALSFWLGVQAGTTNFVNDAAGPTQWWGIYNQLAWAYAAGTPDYFVGNSNMEGHRKRGTVVSSMTAFANAHNFRIASVDNHVLIGYRIQKTTPTATKFAMGFPNSTSVSPSDATNAQFLAALEGTWPTNYLTDATPGAAGGPWDVDEAGFGDLDTVVLSWRSSFQQMIVSDIGAAVIS